MKMIRPQLKIGCCLVDEDQEGAENVAYRLNNYTKPQEQEKD